MRVCCFCVVAIPNLGHGGTNFGFWSVVNGGGGQSFSPHETSYDYDSPVSEAGEHGFHAGQDKYAMLQAVFTKHGAPSVEEPALPVRKAFGDVEMKEYAPLLGNVRVLSPTPASTGDDNPPFAESVGCLYGFILYSTLLPRAAKTLTLNGVRDRAQVFVDGQYVTTVYRVDNAGAITIPLPTGDATMSAQTSTSPLPESVLPAVCNVFCHCYRRSCRISTSNCRRKYGPHQLFTWDGSRN